jgi:hypothetical protein
LGGKLKKRITKHLMILFSFAVLSLLLNRASASPAATIAVINPETGDNVFEFPPETPIGTTFIANITVFNVENLATWQINITWDGTIFNISKFDNSGDPTKSDIFLPPDNIFGEYADPVGLTVTGSSAFWVVSIKLGAPFETFSGSGTLCQIKFTVIRNDTGLPLSCNIHFVVAGEHAFYTKLIDVEGELIPYTPQDANFTIIPEFHAYILPTLTAATTITAVLLNRKLRLNKRSIKL